MAQGAAGRGHRWPLDATRLYIGPRRRPIAGAASKPLDWPALMIDRPLRSGGVGYYWRATERDLNRGFPVSSVPLGSHYAAAKSRALELNETLVAWRRGFITAEQVVLGRQMGTICWMFETYLRTDDFLRLSARTQRGYEALITRILRIVSREGRAIGDYKIKALTPLAADRLYQRLVQGPRGEAVCVANGCITVIRLVWRVVRRQYPAEFPSEDPWIGLRLRTQYAEKIAATRTEAYALAAALRAIGHPSLAIVPVACFEWHQRPENVLAGNLRWEHWRPAQRPNHLCVCHGKTRQQVWMPLEVDGQPVFADAEAILTSTPRLGDAVVMTPGIRGPARLYDLSYARCLARRARRYADLPDYVTFDTCRHGGLTELGDADVTEQGVMALSSHHAPEAARLYIKRNEHQRLSALTKRSQLQARRQKAASADRDTVKRQP